MGALASADGGIMDSFFPLLPTEPFAYHRELSPLLLCGHLSPKSCELSKDTGWVLFTARAPAPSTLPDTKEGPRQDCLLREDGGRAAAPKLPADGFGKQREHGIKTHMAQSLSASYAT